VAVFLIFPAHLIQPGSGEAEQEEVIPLKENLVPPSRKSTITLVLLTISASLYILQTNFYLLNFEEQLHWISNGTVAEISLGVRVFSVLFPAIGFVAALVSGWVLSNIGMVGIEIVILGLQILFSVLGNIKSFNLQFATMIAFVLYRSILYTATNAFAIDFGGASQQGKYLGIIYGVSGVVNLGGYLLTWLGITHSEGNWFWVNIGISVVATVAGISLTSWYAVTKKSGD